VVLYQLSYARPKSERRENPKNKGPVNAIFAGKSPIKHRAQKNRFTSAPYFDALKRLSLRQTIYCRVEQPGSSSGS
jgi:hypothetical protein